MIPRRQRTRTPRPVRNGSDHEVGLAPLGQGGDRAGEWFHANAQARVRVAMYSYIGADGPYPPEFSAAMRSSSHHKGVALHPWLVPYRIVERCWRQSWRSSVAPSLAARPFPP